MVFFVLFFFLHTMRLFNVTHTHDRTVTFVKTFRTQDHFGSSVNKVFRRSNNFEVRKQYAKPNITVTSKASQRMNPRKLSFQNFDHRRFGTQRWSKSSRVRSKGTKCTELVKNWTKQTNMEPYHRPGPDFR